MTPSRSTRIRTLFALAALAALLSGAFLWPLPAHVAGGVAYTAHAAPDAPPRTLVQGDHLQLQYHFDLVHEMVRGRIRAFSNPYEFAVDPAAPAPRRVDPFYFPFALPYALLRFVLPDALCWNLAQLLSAFLGLLFCYLLARRFGAGRGAALAVAALANCVPYRWVVLAGGSPTGFGMGLVPGVALGADMAVRDRSVRGGALAGALMFCLYAADLHCFLFAGLALPLWGVLALLRSERGLKRPLGLVPPLAPVAVGGALACLLGIFAKAGYAGTDAAAGRTLRELERHSPDWRAFFDPSYFSHNPDQFYMGWALAALLVLAGLAIVFSIGRKVGRSESLKVGKSTFGPSDLQDLRPSKTFDFPTGLLLAFAILFVFLLALGTHGPLDALPLRLVRKLVPPFRMVRQPLKVFCLLPALYAAFFAVAWSLRPRLRRGRSWSEGLPPSAASESPKIGTPKADSPTFKTFKTFKTFETFEILGLAVVLLLVFFSSHRGMRAGICLEPGDASAAWTAAAADAKARGLAPRALVLPIWPGDSSWSSVYQYHAVRAGIPMLNGYAAVRTHDYADNVFHRFETMTEGDLTDDQLAGLRELGVTHVILHENAFPSKVSLFPFGETLRRHLADPSLRLAGWSPGVWAFAVRDREGNDEFRMKNDELPAADSIHHSSFITHHSPQAAARHWRLDPPGTNAAVKLRSFAEIHREGYGWLVRAEADRELVLATSVPGSGDPATTNRFPAVDGAEPGSWRLAFAHAPFPGANLWTRLETPGEARISDVAFAADPARGGGPAPRSDGELFLAAVDLVHEFGSTTAERVPDDESREVSTVPDDLAFVPGPDPPCIAVEGPGLPLGLPAGRYRATLLEEKTEVAAVIAGDRFGVPPRGLDAPSPFKILVATGVADAALEPDGRSVSFSYDGSSFVYFRAAYDASRFGVLSGILIVPAGRP